MLNIIRPGLDAIISKQDIAVRYHTIILHVKVNLRMFVSTYKKF
ncbi:hypothetical protein SAMN05421747_101356 [Parapedobacter composti]|uniref:Uncharacterized protein n=1 Tax=Parapedobacter composti TaxID=623281 RepID=A0A1I1E616_9SPHI|nr:hypothetical protein SAMN05421747_101356 [Parapedobacter composti]